MPTRCTAWGRTRQVAALVCAAAGGASLHAQELSVVVRPMDAVFGERLGGRARVEVYGAAVQGVVRRGEVYEVRLTPAGDSVGFAVADASLDSLGVGTPVVWRARAALAGDTVQLPALDRARLGAALCEGTAAEGAAALVGVVTAGAAGVAAHAPLALMLADGTARRTRADALGRFGFCGLPAVTTATLRVAGAGAGEASLQVALNAPPQWTRVTWEVAGGGRRPRAVGGVVRDSAGPVAAARVHWRAADGRAWHGETDAAGRFTLPGLGPESAGVVEVAAIGYAPTRVAVAAGPLPAELEVRLARAAVVLPALLAEGRAADLPSRDPEGFAERRALGFGYFLAGEAIRVRTVPSALQLLEGVPGIEFSGASIVSGRVRLLQPCPLRLFLNGSNLGTASGQMLAGPSVGGLLSLIPKEAVEAIEVYPSAAGAPAWVGGAAGGCGAIVVWTK